VLLTIDPGADSGWAYFSSTIEITACGLVYEPSRVWVGLPHPQRVVIERPAIYAHGRQKARPADVITLALRAGEWAGFCRAEGLPRPEYVEPAEWKGQVGKDVCHARAWARLSERERSRVDAAVRGLSPGVRHNVLDAVALGLWAVQR
jgi:hypothetical protein